MQSKVQHNYNDKYDLYSDGIHVWVIDINKFKLTDYMIPSILNESEVRRGNDIIIESARQQYFVGRITSRIIIGNYLNIKPIDVPIIIGFNGKPMVQGDPLFYNISHSGDLIVMAFTHDDHLGIDVECIKNNINFEDMAKSCFTSQELNDYENYSGDSKKRKFYSRWTAKEAALKATGYGLSYPMNKVNISSTGEVYIADKSQLYLKSIPVKQGYVASLVSYRKCSYFKIFLNDTLFQHL